MSSVLRKIKRNKERDEVLNRYGKKPKHACPKCGKLTLFQRKGKNVICVQCKKVVNE